MMTMLINHQEHCGKHRTVAGEEEGPVPHQEPMSAFGLPSSVLQRVPERRDAPAGVVPVLPLRLRLAPSSPHDRYTATNTAGRTRTPLPGVARPPRPPTPPVFSCRGAPSVAPAPRHGKQVQLDGHSFGAISTPSGSRGSGAWMIQRHCRATTSGSHAPADMLQARACELGPHGPPQDAGAARPRPQSAALGMPFYPPWRGL